MTMLKSCAASFAIGLCGLTTFNNMWTQTIRVKWSRNGMSQSFDAGMRAFLEKQLTQRWSVRIDGDLVVPLFSRSIDGGAQVHWDAPPVNASANVSFFVWF